MLLKSVSLLAPPVAVAEVLADSIDDGEEEDAEFDAFISGLSIILSGLGSKNSLEGPGISSSLTGEAGGSSILVGPSGSLGSLSLVGFGNESVSNLSTN